MDYDEAPPLTLSKWPFYLGDALLVTTALAIAILSDWDLSDWQVLSCILGVGLGAGLLCLPFIFEHWLRVRESVDDREARLRLVERKLGEALALTIDLRDESGAQLSRLGHLERTGEALAEMVEQRLGELEAAPGGIEQALLEIRQAQEDLSQSLNQLKERQAGFDEGLQKLAAAPAAAGTSPQMEREQARRLRRPEKPGSRLLRRAIRDPKESTSGAVGRIISAKPLPPRQEKDPEKNVVDERGVAPRETTEAAGGEAPRGEPKLDEEKPASREKPGVPQEGSSPPLDESGEPGEGEARKAISGAGEEQPVQGSAPDGSEAEAEVDEAAIDLNAEVPPMEASDLLFDSLPASGPPRAKRVRKKDSVVTVKVLIGIGNKPFIRGSGGGLSWDQGLPMEFESIGSWRWVAPDGLEEPLRLRIYRNDEDPDRSGEHELTPGDRLEIEPRF